MSLLSKILDWEVVQNVRKISQGMPSPPPTLPSDIDAGSTSPPAPSEPTVVAKTAEQKILELYDSCLYEDSNLNRNKGKPEKVKFDDFGFIEFGRRRSSSFDDSQLEEFRCKEEKRSRVMREKLAKLEREERKKKEQTSGGMVGGSLSARIRKSKRFKRWSYKGFPVGFRGELYSALACSAYLARMEEANHTYERVLAYGRSSSSHNGTFIKQIDADIHRTLRKHSFFSERYNKRQRELFNILVAYAVFNQNVGYCQGLNLLAAILLIYLKQEVATFWALHWLVTEPLNSHSGFLKPGFPKYQRFEEQFRTALRNLLPDVYENLEMQHMPYSAFLPKWFFLIFLEALPFPEAIRAFDIFMMRGHIALIPLAIAIMKHYRKHLSKLSMENLVTFLLDAVPVHLGMDEDNDALFTDFKKVFKRMKKSSLCLPQFDYSLQDQPGTPESFYGRCVVEQFWQNETGATTDQDQIVDVSTSDWQGENNVTGTEEQPDKSKEQESSHVAVVATDITTLTPVPTIQVSDYNNQSIEPVTLEHLNQIEDQKYSVTNYEAGANGTQVIEKTQPEQCILKKEEDGSVGEGITFGQDRKSDSPNAIEATKRTIERAFRHSLQGSELTSPIAELSSALRHALTSHPKQPPPVPSTESGVSVVRVRRSDVEQKERTERIEENRDDRDTASTCSADVIQGEMRRTSGRGSFGHIDGSTSIICSSRVSQEEQAEAEDSSVESDDNQPVDLFASAHELLMIEDEKEKKRKEHVETDTSSNAETNIKLPTLKFHIDSDAGFDDGESVVPKRSKSQFFSSLTLPKQISTRSMSETLIKISQISILFPPQSLNQNSDFPSSDKTETESNLDQASYSQATTAMNTAETQKIPLSTFETTPYKKELISMVKTAGSFNPNLVYLLMKRQATESCSSSATDRHQMWGLAAAVRDKLLSCSTTEEQRSTSCVNLSNIHLPTTLPHNVLKHFVNYSDHINSFKRLNASHLTQVAYSPQAQLKKLKSSQIHSSISGAASESDDRGTYDVINQDQEAPDNRQSDHSSTKELNPNADSLM